MLGGAHQGAGSCAPVKARQSTQIMAGRPPPHPPSPARPSMPHPAARLCCIVLGKYIHGPRTRALAGSSGHPRRRTTGAVLRLVTRRRGCGGRGASRGRMSSRRHIEPAAPIAPWDFLYSKWNIIAHRVDVREELGAPASSRVWANAAAPCALGRGTRSSKPPTTQAEERRAELK